MRNGSWTFGGGVRQVMGLGLGLLGLAIGTVGAEEIEAVVEEEVVPAESGDWRLILNNQASIGHDSNVPILPEQIDVTSRDSVFLHDRFDIGGKYRGDGPHRFRVLGSGQYTHYTDADEFDLLRVGALGSWQMVSEAWMPHLVATINHYRIDGDAALDDYALVGGTAYLHGPGNVSIAALRLRQLDYDQAEDLSGFQYTGRYAHWFVLGSPARRIEVELELGRMEAETDAESYLTIRPGVALRWRWEEVLGSVRTDVHAGLQFDFRSYDDERPLSGVAEDSTLVDLVLGGTWWLNDRWGFGLELRFSDRSSNDDLREYDRTRIGFDVEYSW